MGECGDALSPAARATGANGFFISTSVPGQPGKFMTTGWNYDWR